MASESQLEAKPEVVLLCLQWFSRRALWSSTPSSSSTGRCYRPITSSTGATASAGAPPSSRWAPPSSSACAPTCTRTPCTEPSSQPPRSRVVGGSGFPTQRHVFTGGTLHHSAHPPPPFSFPPPSLILFLLFLSVLSHFLFPFLPSFSSFSPPCSLVIFSHVVKA